MVQTALAYYWPSFNRKVILLVKVLKLIVIFYIINVIPKSLSYTFRYTLILYSAFFYRSLATVTLGNFNIRVL